MYRILSGALFGAALAVAATTSAQAATIVKVSLWDKGSTAAMATDKGVGSTATDPATMGVKLSTTTAKAGEVDFRVTNASKETVHEMVILPYKDGEKIPYGSADSRIDEDAAGHLGEVSELEPGKKGAVKISLKKGKYLLVCNIAGHYMAGMWAMLTVK